MHLVEQSPELKRVCNNVPPLLTTDAVLVRRRAPIDLQLKAPTTRRRLIGIPERTNTGTVYSPLIAHSAVDYRS